VLSSGFCSIFCLMSCSGARVAEQHCLLSRSAHYNRQALFIAFVRSSLLLIIAYKIFEYMNSFTALNVNDQAILSSSVQGTGMRLGWFLLIWWESWGGQVLAAVD
jgi:hypothetical protein